ncbi:serine protease [Butyrivibrio sp. JL13D10]|uniref:S1 family peptidase n=1 Tax=Butyrivibrio sp. JL13D10 TaxID=3236815 RepID=UPI0038B5B4C7
MPDELARDMIDCNAFTVPISENSPQTEDSLIKTALRVRPSTVQIQVGSEYGTGNIISIDSDNITIITAKHVVKTWDNAKDKYVIFYNGDVAETDLIATDDYYDVAVITVKTADVEVHNLIRLKSVALDQAVMEYYDSIKNEVVFSLNSEHVVNAREVQTYDYYGKNTGIGSKYIYGPVINPNIMVNDYGYNMIYVKCEAFGGMSGGGVFDIDGNYVGMLVGGSEKKEMVAVRLSDIEKLLSSLE